MVSMGIIVRITVVGFITPLVAGMIASDSWGQVIVVLRDFSTPLAAVAGFDEDGVRLENNDVIAWDRIAQVSGAGADQAQADEWLRTIGDPLSRVRWRMEIGDFAGARQAAAEIPDGGRNRRNQTELLIGLANMMGDIDEGDSLGAVTQWIGVLDILSEHPAWLSGVPANLSLPADPLSMLHPRIVPIWSSADEPEKVWPRIEQIVAEQGDRPYSTGALVYLASIGIAAGKLEQADAWNKQLANQSAPWATALQWKRETKGTSDAQTRGERLSQLKKWPDEVQAIAMFWLAEDGLSSSDPAEFERAALEALAVPARFQSQFPELAASILERVAGRAQALGDESTAEKLYKELGHNYPNTSAGRRRYALLEKTKRPQ